ncbi:hypothetical protein MCY_00793 [Bartonella rattimassiliensis 15908]|uniref:Uncharacterized protein n=1 Tax=Bartonella rattimassiliensis 15908 TaxID=1094556 RepID=J0QSQ7_9HYPH|nr:hypothetical protein MCY_00793 [Bartonella rattimassiliensis 15908]
MHLLPEGDDMQMRSFAILKEVVYRDDKNTSSLEIE